MLRRAKSYTVLAGHTAVVRHLAFSPDSKRLATAESYVKDPTVAGLDVQTAKNSLCFKGHDVPVWTVPLALIVKRIASAAWFVRREVSPGALKYGGGRDRCRTCRNQGAERH